MAVTTAAHNRITISNNNTFNNSSNTINHQQNSSLKRKGISLKDTQEERRPRNLYVLVYAQCRVRTVVDNTYVHCFEYTVLSKKKNNLEEHTQRRRRRGQKCETVKHVRKEREDARSAVNELACPIPCRARKLCMSPTILERISIGDN